MYFLYLSVHIGMDMVLDMLHIFKREKAKFMILSH